MKIVRAKVLVDHIIRFHLDDGTYVDRDFAFVKGKVFDPIMKDPKKFKQIRVRDGEPYWPGDVDCALMQSCVVVLAKVDLKKFATIGIMGTLGQVEASRRCNGCRMGISSMAKERTPANTSGPGQEQDFYHRTTNKIARSSTITVSPQTHRHSSRTWSCRVGRLSTFSRAATARSTSRCISANVAGSSSPWERNVLALAVTSSVDGATFGTPFSEEDNLFFRYFIWISSVESAARKSKPLDLPSNRFLPKIQRVTRPGRAAGIEIPMPLSTSTLSTRALAIAKSFVDGVRLFDSAVFITSTR